MANTSSDCAALTLPTPRECRAYIEAARQHDPRLDKLLTLCTTGITDVKGKAVQLQPTGVSVEVGGLIHWLTRKYAPLKTIDTGFGYGVAASFFALGNIDSAIPTHYSFEPYLNWTEEVGFRLLNQLGINSMVSVEEELAFTGLANLYSTKGPDIVSVALMDGSSLFDELIADYLAIQRMFRWDEGIFLISQPHMPQIKAFISFLETNRKFSITNWSDEIVVAQRLPGNSRPWYHFEPFVVPLEGCVVPIKDNVVEMIAPDGVSLAFVNETSHQYYLRRVLHGREYPPLLPDVFDAVTILDIGAHVGTATRFFAGQYPNARIVCIEPTPESFELLCKNTVHLPLVERHQVAFTKNSGTIRIWRGQHSSGQNSAVPNEANTNNFFDAIGVEPLRFCIDNNLSDISILKMDIEGLEMDVLHSLEPLLDKIQVVYIEYHSEKLRRQIDDLLRSRFTLFSSKATEAFCGTVGYVASDLLADLLLKTSAPRYTFAKQSEG